MCKCINLWAQTSPHTSGAVFRESNAETGGAEDGRVVVLVQDGDRERNATVQASDVLRDQIELNARLLKGLAVQCGPLTHTYHTLKDSQRHKTAASLL